MSLSSDGSPDRAWQGAAKEHPATLALAAATRQGCSKGTVFVVSMLNHDAEALEVVLYRLAR